MDSRRRLFLETGAVALIAACASRADAATATTHTVTIDAFEFKPPKLTVRRGDTIVWENHDPVPHTVSAQGKFDSGSVAAGATWKHAASTKGQFEYACTFHPTMKGVLIVK